MPNFVKVVRIETNKSGVGSRGWYVRCRERTIVVRWGSVDVVPAGSQVRFYPDFTIDDAERGTTFYWEHLGMTGAPAYDERWDRKPVAYRAEGILPLKEGGGEHGTLIITRDVKGSIDSKQIGDLIDRVLA